MKNLMSFLNDRVLVLGLLAGALCYWVYGQVSNLSEQTELLMERNVQLELLLANQCTTILEQQGFTVVPAAAPPEEPEDGEDPR